MKKTINAAGWAAISCLTIALPSQAADVKINGFASIVGGMTLNQGKVPTGKATYFVDGSNGGTYDEDLSFKPDSLYGLQFRSDLGQGLSVTGQLVGQGGADFEAKVKWAYATYELTDSATVSAGRLRFPLYFYSEYLDVRYAYHWIRGPADSYTLPISEYEGVNLLQRYSVGNWDGNVQLIGGSGSNNLYGFNPDAPFEIKNMIGIIGTIGNDWLQLRAMTLTLDTEREDDPATDSAFTAFAARIQKGPWLAMAEHTHFEFDNPVAAYLTPAYIGFTEGTSWYVSLAYSMGSVTPYVTYSERQTEVTTSFAGNPTAANETTSVGVRWDFHPSAALKVEYNSSTDVSDAAYSAFAGNAFDVDNIAVGVDVVF